MRIQANRFYILLIMPLFLFTYSSSSGKSLMDCAINGDNRCLEALIVKGEDINKYDEWGWTPLLWAVYYGHLETVKLLIEKGANVNVRTMNDFKDVSKNGTALIISAMYDYTDIAYLLIKNGAVDYIALDGQSAYSIALRNESASMLKLLAKDYSGIASTKIGETAIETRTDNDDSKIEIKRHQQIGFGFSIGMPSYLNFVTGGYFSHCGIQLSLLALSTGHSGIAAAQLDIMYLFKNDPKIKYGISLMVDVMPFRPWHSSIQPWYGLGPSLYFNSHSFFIEAGLSFGPEKGFNSHDNPQGKIINYPMIQIGYIRLI